MIYCTAISPITQLWYQADIWGYDVRGFKDMRDFLRSKRIFETGENVILKTMCQIAGWF
jgi:hypothetical protein